MTKIPFEKTIETSYRFAFTNILSVLGVIWLPTLVFFAMLGGVLYLAWPEIHALIPPDLAVEPQNAEEAREKFGHVLTLFATFSRFAGVILLVGTVLRAMVIVGVLEKALGRRQGPVFVYFSLAAPVWRMVGALILAGIIIALTVALTCIAVGVAIWAAAQYAGGVAGLVKFVAVLAAMLWIVYMTFRLVFFLPAVVVAEERIGIGRAWELGGGNFWRILGVLFAVLLPIAIVAGIVSNALFGSLLWGDIQAVVLSHRVIPPREFFAIVVHDLERIWPFVLVFQLLYVTLLTGLGLGAVANAYKGVTEAQA